MGRTGCCVGRRTLLRGGLGFAGLGLLAGCGMPLPPASPARLRRIGYLTPGSKPSGPEPLSDAFTIAVFRRRIRSRKGRLKPLLLDQSFVAGVGNIYADEALWAARLHYEAPTDRLTRPAVRRLLAEVRSVLERALVDGGTSFDAQYVNVNGASGYFSQSLNAYGQQGKPCARCGTPIVREAFMNRSSHLCPHCQRRPRTVLRAPAA